MMRTPNRIAAKCRISVHVLIMVLALGLVPAMAQGQPFVPIAQITDAQRAEWARVAETAADLLDSGGASDEQLEQIRQDLVVQRTTAFDIVQRGSTAVRSLEAQIAVLGPPPAEGETEAEAVAEQRATLAERLAVANGPVLAAQQTFDQSELLIREIDNALRNQTLDAMLKRAPAPINPMNWGGAVVELGNALGTQTNLVWSWATEPETNRVLLQDLLLAIILAIAGTLTLFVAHPMLAGRIERRLSSASGPRKAAILLVLSNLERFAVPVFGGMLIAVALVALDLELIYPDLVGLALITPLFAGLAFWLGHLTFSPTHPASQLISAEGVLAWRGANLSHLLGWVIAAGALVETVQSNGALSPETQSVLAAIVIVTGGVSLWLLGSILRKPVPTEEQDSDSSISSGLSTPVSLLLKLAATASIIAAALGYIDLARQIVFPTIMSLGVIVAAIAIHRSMFALPVLALGRDPNAVSTMGALVPVVLGVALTLAALPVLALFWGARLTDISELWMIALQGVEVGGIRFSLTSALLLIAIFSIGLFATHWVQIVVRTSVLPRTKADAGVRTAVVTFIGYLGVLIASFIAAGVVGLDLSNLAIVAGALSVGIGFGLQAIVSNFLSGIILLVERPIKEGDWIEVAGFSGTVKKIAVRSTRIETFDRHDVIVPNSDIIAGTVKNMTLGSKVGRVKVSVGVAYGSDVDKVRTLLLDIAARQPLVLARPAPEVLFQNLGDSALEFELRCIIRDVLETLSVHSNLLFEIYREFQAAGINIPFPQQDIRLHIEDVSPAARKALTSGSPRRSKPAPKAT